MRRKLTVVAVAVPLSVGVDLLTGYSPVPGYPAALGLLGGGALLLGAKQLVGPLVQRRTDYYPKDTTPDVQEDLRG